MGFHRPATADDSSVDELSRNTYRFLEECGVGIDWLHAGNVDEGMTPTGPRNITVHRENSPSRQHLPRLVVRHFGPVVKTDGPSNHTAVVARRVFLALERGLQLQGFALASLQLDLSLDAAGHLTALRQIEIVRIRNGSKKLGGESVLTLDMTRRLSVPQQHVILWRGSDKDDFAPFHAAASPFRHLLLESTCSAHKEPVRAAQTIQFYALHRPDSVVIALVGKSNAAGPMLAAASTLPVITVPATLKEFPDDVWSSLRMPSSVPVMTVLDPANAMLAALNILSARNPAIYAHLRAAIEARPVNV